MLLWTRIKNRSVKVWVYRKHSCVISQSRGFIQPPLTGLVFTLKFTTYTLLQAWFKWSAVVSTIKTFEVLHAVFSSRDDRVAVVALRHRGLYDINIYICIHIKAR